jgi:hypothetical protein
MFLTPVLKNEDLSYRFLSQKERRGWALRAWHCISLFFPDRKKGITLR